MASHNTKAKEQSRPAPQHDPLLTVAVSFGDIVVQALIDSGASSPVISPDLAEKLGWRDKPPTKMTQADGTQLEARRMVNVHCMIAGRKFKVNAEVLDLGGRQLIL